MASEIDICNLALAHLGDEATVSSISPPEGSAQAEHCARFYPTARDMLLEQHDWRFATRRATLPAMDGDLWNWAFVYSEPTAALKILAVLPPAGADDNDGQPYECEIDTNGVRVIRTNQETASVRYIARVTDTTKFSPLFVVALSWQLASMLAGPILKGDTGAAESKRCAQMAQAYLAQATSSDANQRKGDITHTPTWIGGR